MDASMDVMSPAKTLPAGEQAANLVDPAVARAAPAETATTSGRSERKKGTPWTEDEHRLFLLGLQKLGKGDWRGISRLYVQTRTPTQVASHAQKYFIRLSNVNKRKRRASLFDMVTESNQRHILSAQQQQQQSPAAQAPSAGGLRNSHGSDGSLTSLENDAVAALAGATDNARPPPTASVPIPTPNAARPMAWPGSPGAPMPMSWGTPPAMPGAPMLMAGSAPAKVEVTPTRAPDAAAATQQQAQAQWMQAMQAVWYMYGSSMLPHPPGAPGGVVLAQAMAANANAANAALAANAAALTQQQQQQAQATPPSTQQLPQPIVAPAGDVHAVYRPTATKPKATRLTPATGMTASATATTTPTVKSAADAK